jgi:hypothetical protein
LKSGRISISYAAAAARALRQANGLEIDRKDLKEIMNERMIRINIAQEQELFERLMYAKQSYTKYEDCYIMQYSEHRGDEGQMIGEFMLRAAEEERD